MIVVWLLGAFAGLLTPLLSIASWQAPVIGDLGAFVLLGSQIGQANRYLPIDQLLVVFVAGLAFDLLLTVSQFAVFVYRLVPLKAT